MPDASLNPAMSADARLREAAFDAKTLAGKRAKQPVDRRGIPLPVRKSGYDALDKNSFLKLLVTQLSKQDPTNPMNDREFISQMAQFSALEQMNNVANSMHKLRSAQANQLIGKYASGKDFVTDAPVQGVVTKVTYDRNGEVFLSVNGRMVKLDDVVEVAELPATSSLPARNGSAGGVFRETRAIPVDAGALPHSASAAQAAQAYEANQKANVSRETQPNATINQETPKGE